MLEFRPISLEDQKRFAQLLPKDGILGCEYSFVNLYCWGRQRMAFPFGNATVFSQFDRRSVYLFPVGATQTETMDAIIHDASVRGIPCRLTGLSRQDCEWLQQMYPDRFRFHTDRDSFDYIYTVDELADLTGKKYQKKRNHLNKFYLQHPEAVTEPVTQENLPQVRQMVEQWYALRQQQDPTQDFHMERAAINKALLAMDALGLEGLLLRVDGQVVAMTLGSTLTTQTFDIHFEKALDRYDGAYAVINREFARHLRQKYPALKWLNREDDMGLEGLRKAKLSYQPYLLLEKYWACMLEDGYDY